MPNHFLSRISAGLFFVTFMSAYQGIAQDKQPEHILKEISVYSTLQPQPTFDVPGIASVITPDSSPTTSIAQDIDDLLKFTPGVDVSGGPRSTGQNISIRGFSTYSVLTLIDGRRQNSEAFHNSRFFIDPALIKSIEIVQSGSSSIYGSGAIGGLIAFDTKDASDILAPGENVGGIFSFAHRSANEHYSPTVITAARNEKWDMLANITLRDSQNIRQGGGDYLQSREEIVSGLFKTGYTFNNFHTLKLQAQIYNNDGIDPSMAALMSPREVLVEKFVQDRQFSLKYAFDNPSNTYFKPQIHVYHNYSNLKETDIAGTKKGRLQTRLMKTLGLTLGNQSTFYSDTKKQNIVLSMGVDVYQDKQKGTLSTATDTLRPGVPNAQTFQGAMYAQVTANYHSPVGKFQGITAARLGTYKASSEDKTVKEHSDTNFSPKFSLNYKPIDPVLFFGSVSQAFRSPNLTEIYPSGIHYQIPPRGPMPGVTNTFVSNPDLKKEEVITVEFGTGLYLDEIFTSSDHFKIKGSYFESRGKNFITYDRTATTTQFVNIPEAKLSGWEAEMEYKISSLTAKVGASYVKAINSDTKVLLPNNVPFTVLASLAAELNAFSSVSWNTRFAKDNLVPALAIPGLTVSEGYVVHDLYYRMELHQKDKKFLTLDAGVSNIFDKKYQKNALYPFEEGQSYLIKVSMNF